MGTNSSPTKAMWLLGAIGLGAAVLLAGVYQLTRERIELEQAREALSTLHQVLPPDSYDNELVTDRVTITIPGLAGDASVYRARLDGRPSGAIFEVTTNDGYSGPIRLMAGVDADGRITGVRVLQHRETPGLGDGIEVARSGWIRGFDGRSLGALSSSAGTVAGGVGGGLFQNSVTMNLPRMIGDVRLAADVRASKLPWPNKPKRFGSVSSTLRKRAP